MPHPDDDRNLPAGIREAAPLIIGVIGISIPVALVTVAASGESVAVLVLAIVAMLTVGAVALVFIMRLTADTPDFDDDDPAGGE
jgi:hypothetical protein